MELKQDEGFNFALEMDDGGMREGSEMKIFSQPEKYGNHQLQLAN